MVCALDGDCNFLVDINLIYSVQPNLQQRPKITSERARLYIRKGIALPRTAWTKQNQRLKSNVIVLRMQEDFILRRIRHHLLLQLSDCPGHFNSHTRRPTDEDTRTTAKGLGTLR